MDDELEYHELVIDGTLDLHMFQPREVKELVPDGSVFGKRWRQACARQGRRGLTSPLARIVVAARQVDYRRQDIDEVAWIMTQFVFGG